MAAITSTAISKALRSRSVQRPGARRWWCVGSIRRAGHLRRRCKSADGLAGGVDGSRTLATRHETENGGVQSRGGHRFSEDAWARLAKLQREDNSRMWRALVGFFATSNWLWTKIPPGEIAQALVARWRAQHDEASGGDAEIKGALLHGWSGRKNWPESMRCLLPAGSYMP